MQSLNEWRLVGGNTNKGKNHGRYNNCAGEYSALMYVIIERMQSNSFSYSLKVWLTSVFVAPVVFFLIDLCINKHTLSLGMYMNDAPYYLLYVIFGGILSFFTWLTFLFIIKGLIATFPSSGQIKHLIAVAGTLLTVGTFAFFGRRVFDVHNDFFYMMLSYAICIAGGSYFYNLESTQKPDIISN
ncbi:MAG: hypothetical protein WC615_12890 [Mucilaginibacter sp.]|jgi:hypothetical protein|uniref:hypothetical protein n=1 Tax=Mucilaginibacter sp. TaxID=1882438 RepID=UPI003569B5FA